MVSAQDIYNNIGRKTHTFKLVDGGECHVVIRGIEVVGNDACANVVDVDTFQCKMIPVRMIAEFPTKE